MDTNGRGRGIEVGMEMKSVRTLRVVIAGIAAVVLSFTPASAVPILRGGSVSLTGNPVDPSSLPGATLLDGTTISGVPFTSSSGAFSGSFTEQVWKNAAGLIFFEFFVSTNAGTGAIRGIGIQGFGSFLTDVDFVAGSGAAAPNLALRDSTGALIGFAYGTDSAGIGPGVESANRLYVQTNATGYSKVGGITFGNLNGMVTVPNIFQPTAMPEPGTLLLLGSGLAALAVWGRRSFLTR